MALELAVVALVLVLLNARDRRRNRAIARVLDVLDACPRSLRASIALHARAPLLSRRVVVVLDMSDCERGEVWAAVRPLADALSPHAALVIRTRLDPTLPVAVSVRVRGRGDPATLYPS
jgi:hypothetical protein